MSNKGGFVDIDNLPWRPQRGDHSVKPSNPKDAIGDRKPGIFNAPAQVVAELGLAMTEGALKYGAFNYRVIGVKASVYYNAALRHLMAWIEGEDSDEACGGLSHLSKAMACMAILRDAQINDVLTDDRPPKGNPEHRKHLDEVMKNLMELYPDAVEPYTELNKDEDR